MIDPKDSENSQTDTSQARPEVEALDSARIDAARTPKLANADNGKNADFADQRSRTHLAETPERGWEQIPLYRIITLEFSKFPEGEAKRNFALAVVRSFQLDVSGRVPLKPTTAKDITDNFGFSLAAQKKYRMAFGKDAAFKEFLLPINAPVNQGVYKRLNRESFSKRFSRDPVLLNGKQMVLTVSEWLHFVPHEFECPIPNIIQTYIV